MSKIILDRQAQLLVGEIQPKIDPMELEIPFTFMPPVTALIKGLKMIAPSVAEISSHARVQAEAYINTVLPAALDRVAIELKGALDAALVSPIWAWPAGGPRDIVDTGSLLASGSVSIQGTTLSVNYSSPYADIVHYGGYIYPYGNKNLPPLYLPGRPWIESTLNGGGPVPQFNFQESIMRNLA